MNIREEQGQLILQDKDAIKRIDGFTNVIKSQSTNSSHNIHSTELGWKCDCPDHTHRGVKCKHIFAVELVLPYENKSKKKLLFSQLIL